MHPSCDTCTILQGPAVHALRAQTDKVEYAQEMRRILEETPNLFLREGMAVGLDLGPNDEVQGVRTFFGLSFRCRAAVVTTGTFMNGRIWVGRQSMPAGRYSTYASMYIIIQAAYSCYMLLKHNHLTVVQPVRVPCSSTDAHVRSPCSAIAL